MESVNDREIVITRIFDAPRALVWRAMTESQHVIHWWGPRGFTTIIEEIDVRVGGAWKHVMQGPDGAKYPNKSIFKEIVKPERIVYSHGGGHEDGHGPGAHFVATWTFEVVENGKTRVTIRMVFPSSVARDRVVREFGAIEGGKQTLERLGEYLPKMNAGKQEFVITRTFNAPRELVWKAWTERDRLIEWFGPKGFTMTTAKLDFRPGGIFLYGLRSPDGTEVWGKFVYREIVTPEKIVLVNSFSNPAGGLTRHPFSPTWPMEMLSTTTFTEHEGKTMIALKWVALNATEVEQKTFDSSHDGMNQGWTGTFDQLATYLAKA